MKIRVIFRFGIAILATVAFGLVSCETPTDSSKSRTVNMAAIEGITIPVAGETPVTSITENEQYRGMVIWSLNYLFYDHTPSYLSPDIQNIHSAFAPDTQYFATIFLYPQNDYTLQGVKANFFTVAGAALVSNNANSGIVTAVFTQTGGLPTSSTFTSFDELDWYSRFIPANTAATAYTIKLNVNNLEYYDYDRKVRVTIGGILGHNSQNYGGTKYVYLDLSGSTITSIADALSYHGLTGVTIPDIKDFALYT